MRILSYNIFMPVAEPVRYIEQGERAKKLPAFIASLNPDVVVIQESMTDYLHSIISVELRRLGYLYETEQLRKRRALVQGGVVIFSRFPIINQHRKLFEQCSGSDCLSAKGFVHAQIRMPESDVHVIGTHLQAWPSAEGAAVRQKQAQEMGRYLATLSGPAAVCGDLNEDLYSSPRALESLLAEWPGFSVLPRTGDLYFTVDPARNTLVGADDERAYASRRFPDGCYSSDITRHCECCPSEWLDYVCVRGFLGTMEAVESHLSDHFPVVASMVISRRGERGSPAVYLPPARRLVFSWYTWIVIICVSLVFLLILALVFIPRK
jgi:endonuclease/exonuclease/phosphatase family metal-dependent hydrolase